MKNQSVPFFLLFVALFALAAPGKPAAAADAWLIAVFPLEDLTASQETRGLGDQMAATLTDVLAQSGTVRVVERRQLQQILEEMKLSASGLIDEQTAIQAGRLLGANGLLLGSFVAFQGSVRINVRVVKTETGEILATERASGRFSALFELEEKLAEGVRRRLQAIKP
jgi:curli biogenesis system outer membrane secretion channel CsgG